MKFLLRIRAEVEEDAMTGYAWYTEKSDGLGEVFLRAFYESTEKIQYNPYAYPKLYGPFRRCLLNRFPYAVYFVADETSNRIIVFGLFHCARDPRLIGHALSTRST